MSRRRQDDQGVVLIEAVLIIPILMLLVSGIVVIGFGWQDKMTIETAARAGARTATNLGTGSQADYSTLQTVLSGMTNVPTSDIQRVVVFNADSTDTVPTACKTGYTGVSGVCNVYTASSFSLSSSSFGCGSTSPDQYWCPTSRVSSQSAPGGPDYIGVYVQIQAPYINNMFGISIQLVTTSTIMRIEPT